MVLQHNIDAWNSNRNLNVVTKRQSKSSEKLSSGYKINRAADDAAGLTISEGMRSMIRGLNRASDNAGDGYSLLQTADGALEEIHSILQRGRELSVQAANDSNTDIDRAAIQAEIDELRGEINRIADTTEFNTLKLLDGSKSGDASANPLIRHNGPGTVQQGARQVNPDIVKNPIRDNSVTGTYSVAQITEVETALESIVPKAVDAILNTFSSTFRNNADISSGIGVELYLDQASSVLASVSCQYSYDSTGKILQTQLKLSVNFRTLFDQNGQFTGRNELEATIAHEMMHAFMDDALPNGMLGATNGIRNPSNAFPSWFVEGMAQTAAGGCSNYNDWVNGGLGLHAGMSESQISAIVQSSANSLSSGSTASQYGTGYLACMYLGYLAAGANAAVTSQSIGNGLDGILSRIKDGESLSDVIKDISGGKYTSFSDFQRKFGDNDSAHFISLLLGEAGLIGSGSVIAAGLGANDVLGHITNPSASGPYRPDFNTLFSPASTKTFADGGGGGYNGSGQALMLQVGSLGHQGMGISINDAHADAIGLGSVSVMSFEEAGAAISSFDYAIDCISENRSSIGAFMNRLEHTMANLNNISENTQAAESRLRDTDMAEEMVTYATANILAQAGQSVLAQANQSRQGILQLLQ